MPLAHPEDATNAHFALTLWTGVELWPSICAQWVTHLRVPRIVKLMS